jgi:UDP-N-acetyl-D-mannosaminuronate dehydrogenase
LDGTTAILGNLLSDKHGRKIVCVQGLGFVGAANAIAIASARDPAGDPLYTVVGVDLPTASGLERAAALNQGAFPFPTTDAALIAAAQSARVAGNLVAVTDASVFGEADIIVVEIGLDVEDKTANPKVDLPPFRDAIGTVGDHMKSDAPVLLESTVPPGTTERIVAPLLRERLAARSLPTHQNIRYPGLGVGGNCLSKDPMFGSTSVRDVFGLADIEFPLSTAAVKVNDQMPGATVALLEETFAESLAGKHVLVLGASYREGVGETRLSPLLTLARMLADKGATVSFGSSRRCAAGRAVASRFACCTRLRRGDPCRRAQAVSRHRPCGMERPVVLDANGVLSRQQLQSLRKAGFKVAAIGRGLLQ